MQSIADASVIVRADNLVKRYGDDVAVAGISFEVERGETFGLLGLNGAGKTSTMRMITCVSPVSGGSLTVDGLDVMQSAREIRARLGVVGQHDGLDTEINVLENLFIYGFLHGLSRTRSRARAHEVLDYFGLSGRARSEVDSLSGGMKRRLAVARSFMTEPKVAVLDEPTTGLDPQSRARVWEQLGQLKSIGVTVILSTHYMEEAATLCDRVAIMDEGRILDLGAPDELVARHAGPRVALIRVGEGRRSAVREQLNEEGLIVRELGAVLSVTGLDGLRPGMAALDGARVSYRDTNLEDVFLALAGRELKDE